MPKYIVHSDEEGVVVQDVPDKIKPSDLNGGDSYLVEVSEEVKNEYNQALEDLRKAEESVNECLLSIAFSGKRLLRHTDS